MGRSTRPHVFMFAILKLLFKCKQCGYCCKDLTRTASSEEVEAIAKATNRTFCEVDTKLHQHPCGYLDEHNLCMIQYIKPIACKCYPNFDAFDCPAYAELAEKIYKPGAMHEVCNNKELADLYTKVILKGDLDAAYAILSKLDIKL